MKKFFTFLFLFFLITLFFISFNSKKEEYSMSVMNEIRNYNSNYQEYYLIFDKENLNLSNLKLKLALFNSNDNYIKKVYIKYPNKLEKYFSDKEYFSFYGNSINEKIDNLKDEYINVLKNNNLFSELEEFSVNNIVIEKVVVISDIKNLEILKYKYPNVKIEKLTD